MKKLFVLVVLVGLGACGSPPDAQTPQPSTPQNSDTPSAVAEEQYPDDDFKDDDSDHGDQSDSAQQTDHVEPQMPPHEPERPPCHTLDQTRCPITPGCEWYEKGGKGHCRDQ